MQRERDRGQTVVLEATLELSADGTSLSATGAALVDASGKRQPLGRERLEQLLHALLQGASAGASTPRPPSCADERVARALSLLHTRLAHRWTVQALAKTVGLSRAAFARRFVRELSTPPLRYLAELRLQRAAELLAAADASLAAIAAEVGYESEFAFGRAFKRRFGEPPGAWRKRVRAAGQAFPVPPVRAAA